MELFNLALYAAIKTLGNARETALVFILSMNIKRLTRHHEKHVFFCFTLNKVLCNRTFPGNDTFYSFYSTSIQVSIKMQS